MTNAKTIRFHKLLTERFNEEELRVLCFHLGVGYEDLESKTKSARMMDLIAYLQRRDKLPRLLEEVKKNRPNVRWPNISFDKTDLLVFTTSTQQIRLSITPGGLKLHLEDNRPSETGRHHIISVEEASTILQNGDISVYPNYKEKTGLFDLGPRTEWLYTKRLFDHKPQLLREDLENILEHFIYEHK